MSDFESDPVVGADARGGHIPRPHAGAGATFVGRRDELRRLGETLAKAGSGTPQIVFVEGEPGVGKSALLRRFGSRLEDTVVLRASADESEQALDYGVIAQIISGPQAAATSLIDLAPEASTWASRRTPLSMGVSVLRALGSLQERGVVVLIVDDVQWADLLSAQGLLFVLRHLHRERVLVLLAGRPGGLERLGESWLRLVGDAERVQRVALAGLGVAEVRELTRCLRPEPFSAATGAALQEHTSGNPLYLSALLAELPAGALSEERPLPAPRSFAGPVLARLAHLSAGAQDLVTAVAASGTRCSLSRAARVAALPDAVGALDEAVRSGLLELTSAGLAGDVRFSHPLVRAAVYDDLSPSRRRTLHLRLAACTEGSTSLDHRVAASLGGDRGLAQELIAVAVQEEKRGELRSAAERLLWAARLEDGADAERLLLRATETLLAAGDLPRAMTLRPSVEAAQPTPFRSFVQACLRACDGSRTSAAVSFERLFRENADPALRRRAAGWLTFLLADVGRHDDARRWGHRALAEGTPVPTADLVARLGLIGAGDQQGGLREEMDDARSADLQLAAACRRAWQGDAEGAYDDLRDTVRRFRAGSWVNGIAEAHAALAQVEYQLGRWDEALVHAELAATLAEDGARSWELPPAHAVAAAVCAARGDWAGAERHVRTARAVSERTGRPKGAFWVAVAAARLAQARGDWSAVLTHLRPLREDGATAAVARTQRSSWALLEVEALLAVGSVTAAAGRLDEVTGTGAAAVETGRLRARIAEANGRTDEARCRYAEASALADPVGAPLVCALLELDYGRFLRKAGNRRAALRLLTAAADSFRGLGATPWQALCQVELSSCGVRGGGAGARGMTAGAPAPPGFGLTPREEVVARLVASGKTNREVAQKLFLTTKAIEFHLGNVYGKLGVHSRHQLAHRLAAEAPAA